jgi:CheY-like chemotaxis protein
MRRKPVNSSASRTQEMKLRALIFEDNEALRHMLRMILDRRGYEVFAYPHPGLCPLSTLKACPCQSGTICADLIVSDMSMPEISGIDFIYQLIAMKCKRPHFALMSGSWALQDMRPVEQLGCKIFEKPFALSKFVSWLAEIEPVIPKDRGLFNWSRSPEH